MDTVTLIEKRKASAALMAEITEAGKTENRKLSAVEQRTFDAAQAEINAIDAELIAKDSTPPAPSKRSEEKAQEPRFSLMKAIRSAASGEAMDEVSASVIEAGRSEMRKSNLSFNKGGIQLPTETRATIQSTAATSGQEAISEVKMNFIDPLRATLTAVKAGATFLTGLVGDLSLPTYAGTSALWKGESITAVDGAGATGEVTMTPKRLTTFITVSKQFLAQDSIGAEAMLMNDIVKAINDKLESTIFGKVAGSATQPAGFFASAPSINGSVSFANVVALEAAVDAANAAVGNLCYITNATGRGLLKKTVKVANQAIYMMDQDGKMNGYPVLVTNHIASALQVGTNEEGLIFGNFADLLIGQWGAIDLTVDPYTAAKTADIVITVNAYFDAVTRRSASFKTGSIKA